MADYLPKNDDQLNAWLNNFEAKTAIFGASLGITAPELALLADATSEFSAALSAAQAARIAARSTQAEKEAVREASLAVVRQIAQQSRNAPAATNAVLIELGLSPKPTGPSRAALEAPSALVAVGLSNGINRLVWSKGGNRYGTQFIVEARSGFDEEWRIVAVTTKTKFEHPDQVPGQTVHYRVYAQRSQQQSAVSNAAIVYGPGATRLSLAA